MTQTSSRRRIAGLICALALSAAACSTDLKVETGESASSTTTTPTPAADPTATPEPTPTVEPSPTPTPVPEPGHLSVTDTDAVGTEGDDLLSLVEAVKVANGRLPVAELSAAEAALVTGEPGPDVADTIQVDVGFGTEILFPGGNVWIVELFGNDGDNVNGGGSILTGGVDGLGINHNIILIGSSNVAVQGFTFRGVSQGIGVESAGSSLTDITIEGNAFTETIIREITVLNSLTGGSLTNLTITGNTFDATTPLSDLRTHITVRAASALDTQRTESTSISNLEISGNSMNGPADAVGTCVSIAAGFVEFGVSGDVSGGLIDGINIAGNTMAGCTTAIELTGGRVDQSNGSVAGSTIRDARIEGNTLTVGHTALMVHGGWVKPAPPSQQFNEQADASVTGNQVVGISVEASVLSAYTNGVVLIAGEYGIVGTGTAEDNGVADFSIRDSVVDEVTTPCGELADNGPNAVGNSLDATCADVG